MIGTSTQSSSPAEIRMYLEAASPQELVSLQLQTNILLMGQADFCDFQFANGKWYCWFLVNVDKHPQVLKGLNGTVTSARRQRVR